MEDTFYNKYDTKLGKQDRRHEERHKSRVASKRKYNGLRREKEFSKHSGYSGKTQGMYESTINQIEQIEQDVFEQELFYHEYYGWNRRSEAYLESKSFCLIGNEWVSRANLQGERVLFNHQCYQG